MWRPNEESNLRPWNIAGKWQWILMDLDSTEERLAASKLARGIAWDLLRHFRPGQRFPAASYQGRKHSKPWCCPLDVPTRTRNGSNWLWISSGLIDLQYLQFLEAIGNIRFLLDTMMQPLTQMHRHDTKVGSEQWWRCLERQPALPANSWPESSVSRLQPVKQCC